MPWKSDDAPRHTKAANTPTKRRVWAHVANETLERTGNEGRAIREANAAVSRIGKGKKRSAEKEA